MDSLNQFKINNYMHHCSLCGKNLSRYSKVSIIATDPSVTVNGNVSPVTNSYRFILCPEHFKEFKKTMGEFIKNNAKSSKPKELRTKTYGDFDDIDDLLN